MGDDDLACILGGDVKRPDRLKADISSAVTVGSDGTSAEQEQSNVVTSTLSVSDYFAQRMAAKKAGGTKRKSAEDDSTTGDTVTSAAEPPTKKQKKQNVSKWHNCKYQIWCWNG